MSRFARMLNRAKRPSRLDAPGYGYEGIVILPSGTDWKSLSDYQRMALRCADLAVTPQGYVLKDRYGRTGVTDLAKLLLAHQRGEDLS